MLSGDVELLAGGAGNAAEVVLLGQEDLQAEEELALVPAASEPIAMPMSILEWNGNVGSNGNILINQSLEINGQVFAVSGAKSVNVASASGLLLGQTVFQGASLAAATGTGLVHQISGNLVYLREVSGTFVTGELLRANGSAYQSLVTTATLNTAGSTFLGASGSGNFLDARNGSSDTLTVKANGGNVTVHAAVGQFNRLGEFRVADAVNVTFNQPLRVDGDLVIYASGDVNFNANVDVTGSILIHGTSRIFFGNSIEVRAGDGETIFLQTDTLNLPQNRTNSVISPGGTLVIEATTLSRDIHVASPETNEFNILDITLTDLAAIRADMGRIVIGREVNGLAQAGAGDVLIGAIAQAESFTFRHDTEIYGNNIRVSDYLNTQRQLWASRNLSLIAEHNIVIRNTLMVDVWVPANPVLTLFSEKGSVTQQNSAFVPAQEVIRVRNLHVNSATGTELLWTEINELNARNTGTAGDIRIHTQASDPVFGISGDLLIRRVEQTHAAGSGAIVISTQAGNLTVAATGAADLARGSTRGADQRVTGLNSHVILPAGAGINTAGSGDVVLVTATNARLSGQNPADAAFKTVGDGHTILVQNLIQGVGGTTHLLTDGQLRFTADIVQTGAGHVLLESRANEIRQEADVLSIGGSITFMAHLDVRMLDGTRTDAAAGSIVYTAGQGIVLAELNAQTAMALTAQAQGIQSVSGFSGTYHLDGETETVTLSANTGIGVAAVPLRTRIGGLAAEVLTSGGLFVEEATGLTVQNSGIQVEGSGGHLVLTAGESLSVQAQIRSVNGSLRVEAEADLELGAGGSMITEAAGETVELRAATGVLALAASARVETNGGNLRAFALAGMTLGLLDVRTAADRAASARDEQEDWGAVQLETGGALTSLLSGTQLWASSLRVETGLSLGTGIHPLRIEVIDLAVRVSHGNVFVREASSVAVTSVSSVAVKRVTAAGDTEWHPAVPGAALSGVVSLAGNGAVVLGAEGDLTVQEGISGVGSGNMRLQSGGDVTLRADVNAGSGHLSLFADQTLALEDAAELRSSGSGTVDVVADVLQMAEGTAVHAGTGNIRISVAGEAALARVETEGHISLLAGSVGGLGDAVNLTGDHLRLEVDGAVGMAQRAVTVSVNRLSARAGALYLTNDQSLLLDETDEIAVQRVLAETPETPGAEHDAALNDVIVSGEGQLFLEASGTLILADGTRAVSGSGTIRLMAANDLLISEVISESGDVALITNLGAIRDHLGAETPNVITDGVLRMVAHSGIGAVGTADLNTRVGGLSAVNTHSGDIVIREETSLQIVGTDALYPEYDGVGILNGAVIGSVLLQVVYGDLTVNASVASQRNLLLETVGVERNLTVNAAVETVNGHLTVLSEGGSLLVNARLQAGGIGRLLAAGHLGVAFTELGSGVTANRLIFVASAFDVQLHGLDAGSERVTVLALQGGVSRAGGTGWDVSAAGLQIQAQNTVGLLRTQVQTLAVLSDLGGIDILNAGTVTVGSIGTVEVIRVLYSGSLGSFEEDPVTLSLLAAQDVRLESETGNIVMSTGSRARSSLGDVALAAAGDISVTLLEALEGGGITVNAGARILDVLPAETPNLITTGHADLSAVNGIGGLGTEDIILNVGSVSAVNSTSGRIVLREVNGLTVTGLASLGGDGDILLSVDTGGLLVNGGISAHGTGNIRLFTGGIGSIAIAARVGSEEGLITLVAAGNITVNAELETEADVWLQSGGSIAMDGDAEIFADNLRLQAAENLTLGLLQAQGVSLLAGGWIRRAAGSETNVAAARLRITAGNGIGLVLDKLALDVRTLAAFSAESGMYFDTVGALTVGTVSVTTELFLLSGASGAQEDGGLSGLETEESGNILLLGTGDITVAEAVQADGNGRILVQTHGVVTVNDLIASDLGPMTVRSGAALWVNAAISTTADLWLDADNALTLLGTVTVSGANVRLSSGADVTLGRVNGVAVSLVSDGAVVKAADSGVNVAAGRLRIESEGDVGTGPMPLRVQVSELSAHSADGGIFLREENGLTVTSVAVTVEGVLPDAQTDELEDEAQADLVAVSQVVLGVATGNLILNDGDSNGKSVVAGGNVRLDVETGDLTVNAAVESGGHVTLLAAGLLTQSAVGHVRATGAGTLDMEADSIAMADGAEATSFSGNIRYRASGILSVGHIGTGADVSLLAGNIFDSGAAGNSAVDVIAQALRMQSTGAVGEGNNPLTTDVSRLSARAGAAGLFVEEISGITVGRTEAISVNRVAADGTVAADLSDPSNPSDPVQDDLVSGGALVLVVQDGDFVSEITGGIEAAAAVRLETVTGDLTLGALLQSTDGDVSVLSAAGLFQQADVLLDGDARTLDILAGTVMTQQNGVRAATTHGNLRIEVGGASPVAANVLTLSSVEAGSAAVSLRAGYILDGGDALTDVVAAELRMQAGRGIGFDGENVNAIDTDVGVLTAHANLHGVFVNDLGTLTVDRVAAVTVNVVGLDGSVSGTRTDAAQEDVVTVSGGAVVLEADSLVMNPGNASFALSAGGAGNVRLQARNGNITVNGQVNAGTGNLTVLASGDVVLAAVSQILTTAAAVTQSTVHVNALGSIVMNSGASITTSGGAVRLRAELNVLLGLINAGSGAVAVVSGTGSVLDNQTPATSLNVSAGSLILLAAESLGSAGNALEFNVTTLSARAGGGGLYLLDSASVTVGQVTLTVRTVQSDATVPAAADVTQTQSDARTVAEGALVLRATSNLTLNDANGDGVAVRAEGAGNVLLAALNGSLTQNGAVDGGSGAVSLRASTALNLNADVFTSGSGTLELISETAGLTMAESMTARTDGGNAHLQANFLLTLSRVDVRTPAGRASGTIADQASWGRVSLVSTASGIQARTAVLRQVEAASLRAVAGAAVASTADPVRTEVLRLAAQSGNGGVFVQDASGLEVGTVDPVAILRVAADGGSASQSVGAALAGLRTLAGNGHILVTAGEELTVIQAVTAAGAGGVFLGAGTSMAVSAAFSSVTGNLHLQAQTDLRLLSGASVQTAAPGHAVLEAVFGDLEMAGSVLISAGDAVVRLRAGGGLMLGQIQAQQVSLIADGGSILRAVGSPVNVAAQSLRISASASVGLSNDPLQIQVTNLAAHTQVGNLFLLESDAVTVTSVTVTANAFGLDGLTTPQLDGTLSGVQALSGGHVVLRNLTGSLTIVQTVRSHGAGNVLLQASGGALNVSAAVRSGTGDVTLISQGNLLLNAAVSVESGGTASVVLESGALLSMAGDAVVSVPNGVLRVASSGNMALGTLDAERVSLISSSGSITRSTGTQRNVQAGALRIQAGGSVGVASRHLTLDVNTLTALSANGNLYLTQESEVTVGELAVSYRRVLATAATENNTDAEQSDLRVLGNGHLVLVVTQGNLTLTDGGNADGIAVQAVGGGRMLLAVDDGELIADARIQSGSERITLTTSGAMRLNADVIAGGDLSATSGADILLPGTVTLNAAKIRLDASGDLRLGNLVAQEISLLAGGDVVNQPGSSLNVSAMWLRMAVAGDAGVPLRHLTVNAETISAVSDTGGLHFTFGGGSMTVGTVGVSVGEFLRSGGTRAVSDTAISGLITQQEGDILVAGTGALLVNRAVQADGDGRILLASSGSTVTLNAPVSSGSGRITLSGGFASLQADVSTGGDLSVFAANQLTMGGSVNATAARIRLDGAGLTLGNLSAAAVSLVSRSFIANAPGSTRNITSQTLRIESVTGVGIAERNLTLQAEVLTARSQTGSLFLRSTAGIEVGGVAVSVNEVLADGTERTVSDGLQTGMQSGTFGTILLWTEAGNLVISEAVSSPQGLILLDSAASMTVRAGLQTQGDISLRSGTGLTMLPGVAAAAAMVRMQAGTDLILGHVAADTASLLAGGSVLAADPDAVQVTATALRLFAQQDIGRINVDISRLAANSVSGNITLIADGDVQAGSVELATIGWDRTLAAIMPVNDSLLRGIVAAGDIALTSLQGGWTGAGDGLDDIQAGGELLLTSHGGIGRSGQPLRVDAERFELIHPADGSVFLVLQGGVDFAGLTLGGRGYLYLTVLGDLLLSGAVTVAEGSALLTVEGSATFAADIHASRNVRVVAERIEVLAGAELRAGTHDVLLRSHGDLLMAPGARIISESRSVDLRAAGRLTLGRVEAGRRIDLRAGGAILGPDTASRSAHELRAPVLRMQAGTDILRVLTSIDRVDASAAGTIEIHEDVDVELGRFGLRQSDEQGGSVTLRVDEGEVGTLTGTGTVVARDGFELLSDGELTLTGTLQVLQGDAHIAVGGLQGAADVSGAHLELLEGHLRIASQGAVGETGAPLRLLSATAELLLESGGLQALALADLRLIGEGLRVDAGSGTAQLSVEGLLKLDARARHLGAGDLILAAESLNADAAADTGALVVAGNDVVLDLDSGVTVRSGSRLRLAAEGLIAQTRTGALPLEILGGTVVRPGGVVIGEGAGDLDLLVLDGNLTLAGDVRHQGGGDVRIQAPQGGLRAGDGVRITADQGDLRVELDTGILMLGADARLRMEMDRASVVTRAGGLPLQFIRAVEVLEPGLRIQIAPGVLDVLGIRLDQAPQNTGLALDVANGLIRLNMSEGLGVVGDAPLQAHASRFTATSAAGDVALNFSQAVEITAEGLTLAGGAGAIDVRAVAGSLTTRGIIRHDGIGDVRLAAESAGGQFRAIATNITGPVIRVADGLLDLRADSGVVTTDAPRLEVDTARFTGQTRVNNLQVGFANAVQLADVAILDGNGFLDLTVHSGDLTLAANASVRNLSTGNLRVNALQGNLRMHSSSEFRVANGRLELRARDHLEIATLFSLGSETELISSHGSIVGDSSIAVHLITVQLTNIPSLFVGAGQEIILNIDADEADINGTLRLSRGENPLIEISGVFP